MAQLAYSTAWTTADLSATAYFVKYRFDLWSNFTFFAGDPIHGDQIEQTDDRALGGLDVRFRKHAHYLGGQFTTSLGAQARFDSIDNALYHDEARSRLGTLVDAHVDESQIGVYVEEDARVRRWLRIILGARGQRVDVAVDDHLDDKRPAGQKQSGTKGATLFLPKAMAVVSPIPELDLFASWGRGFHSNDARGAVFQQSPVTLLTPATGYEAGVRVTPLKSRTSPSRPRATCSISTPSSCGAAISAPPSPRARRAATASRSAAATASATGSSPTSTPPSTTPPTAATPATAAPWPSRPRAR
jgi:outer membrane receptor protein involved in Fe transport